MGIADALAGSGMIPPVDASQLNPPAMKDDSRPKKTLDIVNKGEKEIDSFESKLKADQDKAPVIPTEANGLLKAEPKPDAPDPVQGYVSAIGVLGAIGSMFTRHPLTATMNSAAGAITAMKRQDQAAFDKHFDAWKIQNDNAMKLFNYQQDVYKNIMENDRWSITEKRAQIGAQAAAFKDDLMADHMARGDYIAGQQLQLDRDKARDALEEHKDKMLEAKEKRDIFMQWNKENPNAKADEKAAAYARVFDPGVAAAEVRKTIAQDKEFNKNKENYDQAITQIDELTDMVDKPPDKGLGGVTGITGMARRAGETVQGLLPNAVGGNAPTPASDFQSKIDALKLQLPKLLTGTSKSASDERAKVDQILRGTSFGDTPAKTRNALTQLREIFTARAKRSDSYDTGNYKIGDTVMSPDGTRMKITGFDPEDGTPLGEPVE